MPPEVWVKRSEGGDRTPSPRQIGEVEVSAGKCAWPKIEGDCSEDGVLESPSQVGSPLLKRLLSTLVEGIKFRGVEREQHWEYSLAKKIGLWKTRTCCETYHSLDIGILEEFIGELGVGRILVEFTRFLDKAVS
jgi:hypothetical protein